MSLELVKKAAQDFALDKAINYLAKNPERNLFIMLDYAHRLAPHAEQKEKIRLLREHFQNNDLIMEQIKRIAKNPRMLSKFMVNWAGNNMLAGKSTREKKAEELGVSVPDLIVVDPTSACNLKCDGCWAGEYPQQSSMKPELFDRILKEAKELGIYWLVLSGGEPFAYKPLLDIISHHDDMVFMSFTNGTLIDDKVADQLADLGSFSPAFSLEGWEEDTDKRRGPGTFKKVMAAMDRLRERGVFFGASVTVTRNNIEKIFSDDYIDFLVEKGAVYMWSFHYIPVGRNPNPDLMITPEQRAWLAQRVPELRKTKPILVADFWNDGAITNGCIAGGRLYFHINASGDVEPCAFAHFATDNINDKSLAATLQNPLFKAFQKHHPFNRNNLAPCPIIDNPTCLREMVVASGAHPTYAGAELILKGDVADHLDNLSARWREQADRLNRKVED